MKKLKLFQKISEIYSKKGSIIIFIDKNFTPHFISIIRFKKKILLFHGILFIK